MSPCIESALATFFYSDAQGARAGGRRLDHRRLANDLFAGTDGGGSRNKNARARQRYGALKLGWKL